MKKILFGFGVFIFTILLTSSGAYSVPIYQAPNVGNASFYPLMQHQMEKQETLDFVNDSENYRKKREKRNEENKIRESNFNPNYSPNYGGTYLHPVHPVQMQFTKDANGNIKIQGIQSNSETILNTDK